MDNQINDDSHFCLSYFMLKKFNVKKDLKKQYIFNIKKPTNIL